MTGVDGLARARSSEVNLRATRSSALSLRTVSRSVCFVVWKMFMHTVYLIT